MTRETPNIFERLQRNLASMARKNHLADKPLSISARPLKPGEAIGNPEATDYPLMKGKESLMEATFLGARGQAFTDMYGNWNGTISDLLEMNLENNFRRAVFVSSLNAVMRYLGLAQKTVHCRDDEPVRCGEECLRALAEEKRGARVALVGLQPRMLERLASQFEVTALDMDSDNIGKLFSGVRVLGPEMTQQLVQEADVLLVTGTTLVNATIQHFLNNKAATIFYGVTIAGAAELLGMRRFCPFGR